jgi:hypothetical protein
MVRSNLVKLEQLDQNRDLVQSSAVLQSSRHGCVAHGAHTTKARRRHSMLYTVRIK